MCERCNTKDPVELAKFEQTYAAIREHMMLVVKATAALSRAGMMDKTWVGTLGAMSDQAQETYGDDGPWSNAMAFAWEYLTRVELAHPGLLGQLPDIHHWRDPGTPTPEPTEVPYGEIIVKWAVGGAEHSGNPNDGYLMAARHCAQEIAMEGLSGAAEISIVQIGRTFFQALASALQIVAQGHTGKQDSGKAQPPAAVG